MTRKRVLITSYHFEPEITPRAFRTTELVNEFLKKGYHVDLFIPANKNNLNLKSENYSIFFIGNNQDSTKKLNEISPPKKQVNLDVLKKILSYFLGEIKPLHFAFKLFRKLMKFAKKDYDLIISIGLPFYNHLATSLFINLSKQKGITVCDYGDPFYYNPDSKKAFYFKIIEKFSISNFSYISIPTEKSISYYTDFIEPEKIKIIPQGFDFSKVVRKEYKKNKITTFCYAGYFYEKIRNPRFFFEYLEAIESDYKFVIYTNLTKGFSKEICEEFEKRLGEKLVLKDFIPRLELIKELSQMDFLLNLDNLNSNQIPSKLIDYGLSDRPIISFDKNSFNEIIFNQFLKGNFSNSIKIDVQKFNIENIVGQFEKLLVLKP